jgi:hypothetical protein
MANKIKPHSNTDNIQKGRGSQVNPHNRFFRNEYVEEEKQVMPWDEPEENPRTQYIDIFPKAILSENNSPDLGFRYGINPYNGCEHGCARIVMLETAMNTGDTARVLISKQKY